MNISGFRSCAVVASVTPAVIGILRSMKPRLIAGGGLSDQIVLFGLLGRYLRKSIHGDPPDGIVLFFMLDPHIIVTV